MIIVSLVPVVQSASEQAGAQSEGQKAVIDLMDLAPSVVKR